MEIRECGGRQVLCDGNCEACADCKATAHTTSEPRGNRSGETTREYDETTRKLAEEFCENAGAAEMAEKLLILDAIANIKSGIWTLSRMMKDKKRFIFVGKPEFLENQSARLTLQIDPLYGKGKNKTEEMVFRAALDTWGVEAQMKKMVEELGELIVAAAKTLNQADNAGNLTEEMADVEIMLEQIKLVFNTQAAIREWREMKLERLAGRLDI